MLQRVSGKKRISKRRCPLSLFLASAWLPWRVRSTRAPARRLPRRWLTSPPTAPDLLQSSAISSVPVKLPRVPPGAVQCQFLGAKGGSCHETPAETSQEMVFIGLRHEAEREVGRSGAGGASKPRVGSRSLFGPSQRGCKKRLGSNSIRARSRPGARSFAIIRRGRCLTES
jgi:hypothetical protein